ncbi:MAG: mannitol dehydrogenase family protein [Ruminiclostridium sp.]
MKLNRKAIKNYSLWQPADIQLPKFDHAQMVLETREKPTWVHFGAGNIFRGFIAGLQQTLLDLGKTDTGIIAVETYDYEIIDRIYKPYDNLSLLVHMNSDGSLDKRVVGSISEGLVGDVSREEDWKRLNDIFCEPALQMVSFTITEKGYSLTGMAGDYLSDVKYDIQNGIQAPKHLISKITSLVYKRYLSGEFPIALVSMDNCSHNGEILQKSILELAQQWLKKGFVDGEFLNYISNPQKVSFPWTMIDKITPRPSEKVKSALAELGLENTEIICTSKNTYISQFVNAERPEYLVIEDHFPNGRMPLELAGVLFTDRKTVEQVERMKVTTCLNPLHTALAIFGCLLGYTLIADEMKNIYLKKLVEKIGYDEGMPVVVNPGILEPAAFIDEVINERLPNPYIPDTPQRIACDTSQKMPVRFGETINTYFNHPVLDVKSLTYIPLVIAAWCRYLMGIDDCGEVMELSPDPMLQELKSFIKEVELGNVASVGDHLKPLLSNERLFDVNLYEIGLGYKVEGFFKEMIIGKNAVKNVLEKYIN